MTDTVFRTKQEVVEPTNPAPDVKRPHTGSETTVEPPYLDYEKQNSRPYLVDYFKLGDTWSEAQGGFTEEIGKLGDYIEEKVNSGDIANSTSAVKEVLKGLEKMTNMSKEERATVKVETLAAYVDFLMTTDDIKGRVRRYHSST